jgi:hypothetical protein
VLGFMDYIYYKLYLLRVINISSYWLVAIGVRSYNGYVFYVLRDIGANG